MDKEQVLQVSVQRDRYALHGRGPPFVVFSAQLSSSQRDSLREYCKEKGTHFKVVEQTEPEGKSLVVWKHNEPTELEVTAGAPRVLSGVVVVPTGVREGETFNVQTPDGQMLQFMCPTGQGPGSSVEFEYTPLVATRIAARLDPNADRAAAARVYAKQRQEQMMASGYAEARPALATTSTLEFQGYRFPTASFALNQSAMVTRSNGEESHCVVVEVSLTVLGPWYCVYLEQNPDGTALTKWVEEHDLRMCAMHL